jgi:hypothetical protein
MVSTPPLHIVRVLNGAGLAVLMSVSMSAARSLCHLADDQNAIIIMA